jgi:3-oxoacyl-[acyl-carrier-protein] synthase-1
MELPDGKSFPTGLISWDLGELSFELPKNVSYAEERRIIRLIDAALEQIRPYIDNAITKYGHEKIGVSIACCDNGSEGSLKAHKALIENGSFPADYTKYFHGASFSCEFIADKFGLKGPAFTVATACASGASAIARGAELLQSGVCDAVITGAADIVSQTVLMGFDALGAVSPEISVPFSKNRKGTNLGEGAAFFLLEREPPQGSPSSKQAPKIKLLGCGESSDAYHITAPGTDGEGPVKAMKAAICGAGIKPEQIGYVNLHGTGTPLNDVAEAAALNIVFGGKKVPVSSTKPIMGHTQGAAGALEAAVCWLVLNEHKGLPVHCWDGQEDEELNFRPFTYEMQSPSHDVNICMNNNFGFGGCNVSLIMGRE